MQGLRDVLREFMDVEIFGIAAWPQVLTGAPTLPATGGRLAGCTGDTVCRPPYPWPDIGRGEPVARPPSRPSGIAGVSAGRAGRAYTDGLLNGV